MKNIVLLCFVIAISLSPLSLRAQDYRGSVTVFSEGGEKFTLFLNGDKKNANPESRVVVDNVTEVPVSFRIVVDGTTHELKKNGIRGGRNCIYAITKNKKGEFALRVKDCTEPFDETVAATRAGESTPVTTTVATSTPAQLSATYADGLISLNDGRSFKVTRVKANGMTYPRVIMNSPQGLTASLRYDGTEERYSAEIPFVYEVKNFENNNSYFTLTIDEGGPAKTWHVKLQNQNGFDLKIE